MSFYSIMPKCSKLEARILEKAIDEYVKATKKMEFLDLRILEDRHSSVEFIINLYREAAQKRVDIVKLYREEYRNSER
ncbi:MAG: hypothetical protein PWQ45_108 [Thermosipho sp. (in: thermotogales)]|nr:hypothetical protein [Thermosipho sp. (in: thermotogales)]